MPERVMLGLVAVVASCAAACVEGPATSLAAGTAAGAAVDYCELPLDAVTPEVVRPEPASAGDVVDDVNWFARPVPNDRGDWIVAFASHDQNYLYNLSSGRRVRIPDRSDAVATPDGRYVTVPSHYTPDHTVNFYDTRVLLEALDAGRDAAATPPVFEHRHPDVHDAYYQSVGVVSHAAGDDVETTVYRMMFSGTSGQPQPGFRIVDYTFERRGDRISVTPGRAMKLCPEIVQDMATPFISKDGRYVAAHDNSGQTETGSLKIFEITALDPAAQTTACELRADLGFAAGKADFSFDGSRLTFHISKHDYLTPFINGGLKAPAITDVVVIDLERDADRRIVGHGRMARLSTSTTEGVGSYFPAFLPDGRVFYLFNAVPKESKEAKRFLFKVVDPDKAAFVTNVFLDETTRRASERLGREWLAACAPELSAPKPHEAPWYVAGLTRGQCEALVGERLSADEALRPALLAVCAELPAAAATH